MTEEDTLLAPPIAIMYSTQAGLPNMKREQLFPPKEFVAHLDSKAASVLKWGLLIGALIVSKVIGGQLWEWAQGVFDAIKSKL